MSAKQGFLSGVPTVAYHATPAYRLEVIRAQGLLPHMHHGFRGIYVFETFALAAWFADAYLNPFSTTAVLEIDVRGLSLEPDPMVPPLPRSWRTRRPLSPDRLRAITVLPPRERGGPVGHPLPPAD